MSGGEGGRGRHVVLAGRRGGRVGARPGGNRRAEASSQELLVEQTGQEGVGWHHLHLVSQLEILGVVMESENLEERRQGECWCLPGNFMVWLTG